MCVYVWFKGKDAHVVLDIGFCVCVCVIGLNRLSMFFCYLGLTVEMMLTQKGNSLSLEG